MTRRKAIPEGGTQGWAVLALAVMILVVGLLVVAGVVGPFYLVLEG